MRVRVRVEDRTYVVEIDDPQAEPVIALVDGHRYELWPQRGAPTSETLQPPGAPAPFSLEREVRAPIPGVIASVSVQAGDTVSVGQELCVLEAMKMRNPIVAGRDGTLAAVHVAPGKHVQHREVLMEFAA